MEIRQKTIILLIFSSFMSVGWGQDCIDGLEVELWGECYNIEETTTLILSGLTGEIPPEIGNLTNLIGLVLSSNQFIGEIPPEIGNLTNLTGLFLNNNQLTGRIPSEIGNLTNLTNLDLSDNELTEEIPPEIGNLTNLFQLLLNNNQLMGEIPESICNIDIFWISFPYFDIDNNQLCPPYPDCISEEDIGYQDTSECEEPSLCDEGYTEIDGECYYQSDLDVVQDFIDSNESLNGYSPITLTSPNNWLNGHLKTFLLYDRGITSIPESIGNLDSLDMIYFFENEIESVPESIGNLINLTFLDLGRNNISNIPDTIWDLVNLTTLNFQENQLTSISDEVCNIYSNLEYEPFLSMNQICPPYPECLTEENIGYQDTSECFLCEDGYIELWGECYTITFTTYLDLSEMGLSGEIPSEIGDLTNLTNLDLGGNQLSGEIPSEICNLNNLSVLDLGGNQLSGEIPSEICNLTNLTELELGGNQLSGEIPSCIGNLTNLTFLHLEYNQLSGEIPSEIGNLTNLIWLNFIHNQLSGEIPSSICNLDMSWSNPNNFNIYENQLCPPYPECIEDYVGEQDTSECVDCLLGDINNDSILNILDIVSMITLILDGEYDECGDVNSDGELNVIDVVIFVNIILSIP